MKSSTVPATLDSLGSIAEYVMAAAAGLDKRASYRLRLAVDEIATNIIVYGHANAGLQGALELHADMDDKTLMIAIEDTGVAYDPRQAPVPDTELPLEQRPIGGLGIYRQEDRVDPAKRSAHCSGQYTHHEKGERPSARVREGAALCPHAIR